MDGTLMGQSLGTILRDHRIRRRLTQHELARLSSVSVRAIRDIELGRSQQPRRETIRLIADGLGLSGRERAEFEKAAGLSVPAEDLTQMYQTNLIAPPFPLETMIGRRAELSALTRALTSGRQRLVSITGLTGIGKTRLALEIANILHDGYRFAVLWNSTDRRYPTPSTRLDPGPLSNVIKDGLERLHQVTCESVTALASVIGDHATLMVLDEEHLPPAQADNVMRLLRECENLRVVTTAGQLGIRGERTLTLPPLETPTRPHIHDPTNLNQFAAVQLLTSYASQVRADFQLTVENSGEICLLTQYVDGIPAALEALASWLLIYEPEVLRYHADRELFNLLESPPDPESAFTIQKPLHEAIKGLESRERRLLEALLDRRSSWSVNEVANLTEQDPIQCARLVRTLLTKGLIRSIKGSDRRPRFQVLNLVRRWYRWPDDLPIGEYRLAGVGTFADPTP